MQWQEQPLPSTLIMLLAQMLVQLHSQPEQPKNSFQLAADFAPYPWKKVCWFKGGAVQKLGQLAVGREVVTEKSSLEFTAWETGVVLEGLDRKAQQRKGQATHAAPSKAEGNCRYELGTVQAAAPCQADFLWLASNLPCAPLQRIPEFNSLHWTFLLRLKSLKVFVQ